MVTTNLWKSFMPVVKPEFVSKNNIYQRPFVRHEVSLLLSSKSILRSPASTMLS